MSGDNMRQFRQKYRIGWHHVGQTGCECSVWRHRYSTNMCSDWRNKTPQRDGSLTDKERGLEIINFVCSAAWTGLGSNWKPPPEATEHRMFLKHRYCHFWLLHFARRTLTHYVHGKRKTNCLLTRNDETVCPGKLKRARRCNQTVVVSGKPWVELCFQCWLQRRINSQCRGVKQAAAGGKTAAGEQIVRLNEIGRQPISTDRRMICRRKSILQRLKNLWSIVGCAEGLMKLKRKTRL